jgi:UDP-N-acetylglucosamine--N-acetylmuramyl-(pentapeptide) pyrophosphoryl-undecaprenol N-acetylglucosamine transferase
VRHTEHLPAAAKVVTGNPVRAAIAEIGARPYHAPDCDSEVHLLVFGGSQGARVFGKVTPAAVALLPEALRSRLKLVQQVRAEDMEAATAAYRSLGFTAELKPFFTDMPERFEWAHLVVSRSGASSVAELAAAGRPGLMIPLPSSIDDHQRANAASLVDRGAGWLLEESVLTPDILAARLWAVLNDPTGLAHAAEQARAAARRDAAERLADVVAALVPGTGENR